ncbi:MAG: (2Fe-2S)-binding protein [Rhodospirillaceae bacterium]|nr:(2Fe-2S)-binding protein [Rhodospirillaceae bacterium]|tara:strand:- start:5731 stop:6918 length:1188 start_codon:yes stop_codon:yes gene_type:complete
MPRKTPIDQILSELHSNAERPFEGARAAPAGIYTSPDFLELELEHVFSKEWICAGRAESLKKTGDYLTLQIADQPIFVIRDKSGGIRAYSNVCLHRMSILLEGTGNKKFVTCPYHAWSYDLDGNLRKAPYMDGTPEFEKKDYCLPTIRCELWDGWIYVTLNPDIEPVAKRLQSIKDIVTGRYQFENYVETFREEHIWDTNWKVLAENFMESYHLFQLHGPTIGKQSKVEEMDMPPGNAVFNYHWITKESEFALANAHPDCRYLEGEWRRTTALITIYPGHMITLTPGYFWYLVLQPHGVGQVKMLYGGGMAPDFINDPQGAEHVAKAKQILDDVNEEDRIGTQAVFRGMNAGLARPGHLSYLERPNHEFNQYLARLLTGATACPEPLPEALSAAC